MNILKYGSSFVFFALSLVFLFALQSVCSADLTAEAKADGRIEIDGISVGDDIYRDTSPLEGRLIAELPPPPPPPDKGLLWEDNPTTVPWFDGDDADHPTTDGTLYYYAVDLNSDGVFSSDETDSAIADKTAPRIENIVAIPSPFSPDDDGYQDTTTIFFTLTEAAYVTLKVYTESGTAIRTLLDGTELLDAGDNFIKWDGKNDAEVVQADGRYLYRFDAADNEDAAENTLIQDISGDIIILTAPFELTDISVTPTPFSPNGDNIHDCTYISYEITADADYVAGNIFAVTDDGPVVVAQIYTENLYYDWDPEAAEWVVFDHVDNGIWAGLSSEMYYLKPINPKIPSTPGVAPVIDEGAPPFDVHVTF